MKGLVPALNAVTFACIPLTPAFITLAPVTVPGISLLPPRVALVLLLALGTAAAAYAVRLLVRRAEPGADVSPVALPLLLWLCAGLLAALLGFNPLGGLLFIGIFGAGIVWHAAVLRFYRDPGAAAAICWSYVLSGALASALAIAMVLLRWPGAQYTIGHGRAIGTFILPGELAGYLLLYLPFAYAIAVGTRRAALRACAWCGIALGAMAFIMTFSRTGWMGMAAAIAFYVTMTRGRRLRYALIPAIVGIGAVLLVFNVHHNPSENYTRLSIWEAARAIVNRFPLTGVGPFDFARVYPLVRLPDGDATAFHAHSFLLTVFAETGVVGVAAVLYAWWRFATALHDRLRAAAPACARLALAVTAGLVGTWVQGIIDTVSVVIFGLWLPTMALALALARDGLMEGPK